MPGKPFERQSSVNSGNSVNKVLSLESTLPGTLCVTDSEADTDDSDEEVNTPSCNYRQVRFSALKTAGWQMSKLPKSNQEPILHVEY